MKRSLFLILVICQLLAGCRSAAGEAAPQTEPQTQPQTEAAAVIRPLPDTTFDNLTDAVLSVSLAEGDAYVDDEGRMQMDLTVYTYDRYDMVDISLLKAGDTLVTHAGEVEIRSVERDAYGTVRINGGLDEDGIDLVTDDSGTFYEKGYNDIKSWYEIGQATIRVSADFTGYDSADPERGEVILYPGDFLIGEVKNYDFTPYNTTIRVEEGQIVEMHRRYIP